VSAAVGGSIVVRPPSSKKPDWGERPVGFCNFGGVHLFKSTDGCAMVHVEGAVDVATAPRVLAAVSDALADGSYLVFVDLAYVIALGAAGAIALTEARHDCQGRGGNLVVLRPSVAATRVLKFTGLLEPVVDLSRQTGNQRESW
jgi:anti-anti-sigma factor